MSLLTVSGLSRAENGKPILTALSFTLGESDILFVRGPSG